MWRVADAIARGATAVVVAVTSMDSNEPVFIPEVGYKPINKASTWATNTMDSDGPWYDRVSRQSQIITRKPQKSSINHQPTPRTNTPNTTQFQPTSRPSAIHR